MTSCSLAVAEDHHAAVLPGSRELKGGRGAGIRPGAISLLHADPAHGRVGSC
ncbi:hypothetical protein I546_6445 [Mycobacterium kansasii 732]|nr:hypothetical protein I546_6445 [Mycobacterium kansasii 732]